MLKNFSTDKKRLISNFFSLSSVEATNYILPLVTLPYLVRVLGPEKYGLVAFAQALVQYFILLTDYGFNLSATRNISICRNDIEKVSKIFTSVMAIKLVLMVLSFFVMTALVFIIPKFRTDWLLYFFTFGIVIGNALFPLWFFLGMERMRFIAFINLFSKLIFVIAIFVFIRTQADYIYVPLITSLGFIIAGILSIWILFNHFKININYPYLKDIKYEMKEGWHIFITTAAYSLYTSSNTIILGFLTNNTIVGYYNAAEKLIRSSQRLINPISQAIYPHISRLVSDSRDRALSFIKKILIIIGSGSLIASLGIFTLATPIVNIILGPQYRESVIPLRILAFIPFLVALGNIFIMQGLINFSHSNIISKITIRGGILNLLLAPLLIYYYKQIGLSLSVLIVEMFITIQGAYYFNKYINKREII